MPLYSLDRWGRTVKNGRYVADVATLLLDRGADNNGSTPLHDAAWHEQADFAVLLLDRGADVNAKNNDGWTPTEMTENAESQKIRDILVERGGRENEKN